MIPELGHFALIIALAFSILQLILPLWGSYQQNTALMKFARPCVFAQSLFLLIAFFSLAYAFVSNDFSVKYVAENSHTSLPIIYRFCAVWGAHEGSMLLWIVLLSLWSSFVAYRSRHLSLRVSIRALAILGFISAGFLLFLLLTSNPFSRLFPDVPLNGRDLNPLLQDPGFITHPPMLYMGYVGFAIPFAWLMAFLLEGRIKQGWIRWLRPYVTLAWAFLSMGITLGSWWAYRELGWGGWWFWDPVENASFMPWLAGTALIHSLAVSEKRNGFFLWTIVLALIAFALSLLGTFLVRSGVLTSIHAFASDPARGVFMLLYFVSVVGGGLILVMSRAHHLRDHIHFKLMSRETLMLANNVLLVVILATILLGTLYPLFIDALGLGKLSVGAPYFNAVFVPLAFILFFLMGMAPHLHWHRTRHHSRLRKILLIAAVMSMVGAAISLPRPVHLITITGVALAIWILINLLTDIIRRIRHQLSFRSCHWWGMVFAHCGIALTLLGITISSAYSIDRDVRMKKLDTLQLKQYDIQFVNLEKGITKNYEFNAAIFNITNFNKQNFQLRPEKRYYPSRGSMMTDADINVGLWRDIYIALGEPYPDQTWSVRIYFKPFIRFIWYGGILMLIGGLIAASRIFSARKTV